MSRWQRVLVILAALFVGYFALSNFVLFILRQWSYRWVTNNLANRSSISSSEGGSNSDVDNQQLDRYFTYENPGFAYFNNQLILHLFTATLNPLSDRRLVSPMFRFPAIQGSHVNRFLPLNDVYNASSISKLGFVSNVTLARQILSDRAHTQEVNSLKELRAAASSTNKIIKATNNREFYWQTGFTSFVVLNFLLKVPAIYGTAMRTLQFADPLEQCVQASLKQEPRIKEAIGLHLRTWPSHLSFGVKDACNLVDKNNPLHLIYGKCGWTSDYIHNNVLRYQLNDKQPVMVITDNKKHETITGLQQLLGDRVFFYDMAQVPGCKAAFESAYGEGSNYTRLNDDVKFTPKQEVDWRMTAYEAIIENELLRYNKVFVGSFFSTFSQIAALKRSDDQSTYYFMNWAQYWLWKCIDWLLVSGGLLIVTVALAAVLATVLMIAPKVRHWIPYNRNKYTALTSEDENENEHIDDVELNRLHV